MTIVNAINNDIKIATGTSLNLGASTTIDGIINDTSMATASATTLATSSSIKSYMDNKQRLVQIQGTLGLGAATGGTTTPYDDTIPQITEGNVILGLFITPKFTGNTLIFNCVVNCSPASTATVIIALYQDSVANALASTAAQVSAGAVAALPLNYVTTAPSTSSINYTVRIGASTGNISVNGIGGARKLGGVTSFIFTVKEYGHT